MYLDISQEEFLRQWSQRHSISKVALAELICDLNERGSCLPSAEKLLFHNQTRYIVSEDFVYFGIEDQLRRIVSLDAEQCVELFINFDGVSITNSSSTQMWPISVSVRAGPVFLAGLFYGFRKPNVNVLLRPLIDELHQMRSRNLAKVSAFICDIPAKKMMKYSAEHTGYHSCDYCCAKGVYFRNRVTYCLLGVDRTDLSFRNKTDWRHHKGSSLLEELDIDMVKSFPIDYMHAVCLGTVRRILMFLFDSKFRSNTFVRSQHKQKISENLIEVSSQIPLEFQRCSRSLAFFKYWKATEFRMFLLYIGPLVLKSNIPQNAYQLFILLHCAISILCSPEYFEIFKADANNMLRTFVNWSKFVLGKHFVTLNVHYLLHLVKINTPFGPLDVSAAFKFETGIGKIKRMLHGKYKPLKQIINRYDVSAFSKNKQPVRGTMINNYFFRENSKNAVFLANDGKVCLITKIEGSSLLCKVYEHSSNLYDYPFPSSKLNIFYVQYCGEAMYQKYQVLKKCCMFCIDGTNVVFPLIH